jgi:hypothetical protein
VLSTLSEITTCVAFVVVTLSVDEPPRVIVVGFAVIVTVGTAALGVTVMTI